MQKGNYVQYCLLSSFIKSWKLLTYRFYSKRYSTFNFIYIDKKESIGVLEFLDLQFVIIYAEAALVATAAWGRFCLQLYEWYFLKKLLSFN